jgi:N-acetylmuramoyl-L-alanine amidase
MRVMLTRDADYFVPLHERVRKARRVQADLFVSIHADAFCGPQARGRQRVRAVRPRRHQRRRALDGRQGERRRRGGRRQRRRCRDAQVLRTCWT